MRIEGTNFNLNEDTNAATFDSLLAVSKLKPRQDETPAYRMATNNEVWPGVMDIEIVDVPQDAKDKNGATGQSIAFKSGDSGQTTVVRREDNPGLFDYIESVSKLAENTRTYLGVQDKDVGILRGSETIKLGDVKSLAKLTSDGQALVITAFMQDGSKKVITRELTPEQFDKVAARYESQARGYELVTDEAAISKEDLDGATIGKADENNGLIEIALKNGDKKQISADTTPELFARAGAKYDEFTASSRDKTVDEARAAAKLPTASELDIPSLETSEKDADGKPLSVNDLAWKNVIEKWKVGIEKGEIGVDDDRAKLYRLLKAESVADSGVPMVTLDIGTGYNSAKMTGEDFDGIIDADKIDAAIPKLMATEAVSNDIVAERKTALGKVNGGEETFKKLEEMANSPEYMKYLQELKASGKGEAAEDDIAATYEALMSIDPAKAASFAQNAQMDSLAMELNDLIGDTSKINDENLILAAQDVGKMILTILKKAGLDVGRRLAESEKFIQEMIGDKKTAKDFGKAMQELGALYSKNGEVTTKDVENLIGSGKYTALADMPDGGALKAFMTLTKQGVIGSLGGTISLVSGIYQLAGKGGKLGTTEERLSVAKDFVSFIGAGKHFGDLANHIIGEHNLEVKKYNEALDEQYKENLFDVDVDRLKKTPVKPLLGLGGTLDDLVKAPSDPIGGKLEFTEQVGEEFDKSLDEAVSGTKKEEFYQKRFTEIGLNPGDLDNVKKGMLDGYVTRPGVDAPSWQKGVSGAMLVLSAGADTFAGVADAVIGGLTIKKGVDGGDDIAIAKGALQLASGTAGTAGGLASLAGLSKGLSFLKAVAAPSFVISAVLSLATLIPDIINDIKNTEKMKAYEKELSDLFTQLDKDGLLTKDGLVAFKFLEAYMQNYGQRDAPDDVSILEYRKEEFDYFVREGHLPEEGWSDVKHEDYKGDGSNLTTQMENYG